MLKLNNQIVTIGNFPDGTMLIKQEVPQSEKIDISWFYENDKEMVALIYLVNHVKAHGCDNVHLYMPYIPNARQDRVKNKEDVFTLKYFANIINFMIINLFFFAIYYKLTEIRIGVINISCL